jgi:5-methylcytosine-specific restriction endonuclease McrA
MNWISQVRRLAIYLRDGCACVWCGATFEAGAKLTLDHVVGHAKSQNNGAANLVTACHRCNTSRNTRSAARFAAAVAGYLNGGATAAAILAHVHASRRRSLEQFMAEARALVERRGSARKALEAR